MAAVPAPTGAGGRRAGRGGRGSAVAVAGLDDLALVGAGLAAGGGGWRGRAGLCRRAVAAGHPAAPPSALTGRFCCTAAILPDRVSPAWPGTRRSGGGCELFPCPRASCKDSRLPPPLRTATQQARPGSQPTETDEQPVTQTQKR